MKKYELLSSYEYDVSDIDSLNISKLKEIYKDNFSDILKVEIRQYDNRIEMLALWYYDGTAYTFNEPTFENTIYENLNDWKEAYDRWINNILNKWKIQLVDTFAEWLKASVEDGE